MIASLVSEVRSAEGITCQQRRSQVDASCCRFWEEQELSPARPCSEVLLVRGLAQVCICSRRRILVRVSHRAPVPARCRQPAPSGDRGWGNPSVVSGCGTRIPLGVQRDGASSTANGQLLLPWPGRCEGGTYTFQGVVQQLAITGVAANIAQHGLVRFMNWQMTRHDSRRLVLELVLHPQLGYPFILSLRQEYELTSGGLHLGGQRLPAGGVDAFADDHERSIRPDHDLARHRADDGQGHPGSLAAGSAASVAGAAASALTSAPPVVTRWSSTRRV